jgi:hypothetical protein
MASPAPRALGARWASLFEVDLTPDLTFEIDNARLTFVNGGTDALARVHLAATSPTGIIAAAQVRSLPVDARSKSVTICGVEFCFQDAAA